MISSISSLEKNRSFLSFLLSPFGALDAAASSLAALLFFLLFLKP
jgi:hypothetical protein